MINQLVLLKVSLLKLANLTRRSMVGTSTSTPTTVARAAGDWRPKRAMETATASSKKLLAPIMAAGAAMRCGKRHFHAQA